MADLKQLIKNIEQWAEDRNLIEGSTPQKQFIKLMEEFGELCGGISKNNIEQIKDSIGDCEVVLIILNKQLNCKINF
ncbi:pyrophosphatase, partial [Rodentibacter pneumotropicus]